MRRRRINLILLIAVFAFCAYAVYTLLSLQIRINDKREQIASLSGQITEQQQKNDQLQQVLDRGLTDEDVERIARDQLGLALPNERVYVNPVQ